MQNSVYHSRDIQAWEQRWFAQQNSSVGLMQQAAWAITQQLLIIFQSKCIQRVAVWCGQGNNAGDGYYIAAYLQQYGFDVTLLTTPKKVSTDLEAAFLYAQFHEVPMYSMDEYVRHSDFRKNFDAHIDAMFGVGLSRELDEQWKNRIQCINLQSGLKVSIDLPSGLHADTGQPLPCTVKADHTFTILGYKAGLFTGQGKEYIGQLHLIGLIPKDQDLVPSAYLSPTEVKLPKRQAFGHKGTYGHVLVVGGHADMGGAVIMSAEAAFHTGAGKVTVVCHAKHHQAILARSPNIMVRDINMFNRESIQQLVNQVDAICFGMGLGRDDWAESIYKQWLVWINQASHLEVVLDADALWFLAKYPEQLAHHIYATPHSGEAATLLNCTATQIEQDRILTIYQLQQKYGGQWVLKGAGSLILEDKLWICTQGNVGMATGGMGDVLAGMIAGLKVQFHQQIALHEIVSLHAQAGDLLAQSGMRGLQANEMMRMIQKIMNE